MKIGTVIDKLLSNNTTIALWYNTDQSFKTLFWRGEAWRLGKECRRLEVDKIFGSIPEHILEADTINLLIKSKPIHVCCDTCRKWGSLECPNSSECYAIDKHPQWEWVLMLRG